MWQLPPIPPWNAIHPMIVHFPIALLLIAPLFVLLGITRGPWGRAFSVAGLLLLLLGAGSAVIVADAGESAAELVMRTDAVNAVLLAHEELAETTQTLSFVFSILYLILVITRLILRDKLKPLVWNFLTLAFLLGYSTVLLALINTGHDGGRLVHELGVHAQLPPEPLPPAPPPHVPGGDSD
ncbi:MAG: DUF2231 domain-containing protein [Phycisphaerales bacterium]